MLQKRWILALALVLTLTLVGCTGNGNISPEDTTPPVQDNEGANDTKPQENDKEDNDKVDSDSDKDNDKDDGDKDSETGSGGTTLEEAEITMERALNDFMTKYPNAKVKEVELDKSDGDYFYKVEGYDGTKKYELKMNIENGTSKTEEKESNKTIDRGVTIKDLDKVELFVDKTLKDAGDDYELYEWEVESDRDKMEIKIEIKNSDGNKLEYEYDMDTEELIEIDD